MPPDHPAGPPPKFHGTRDILGDDPGFLHAPAATTAPGPTFPGRVLGSAVMRRRALLPAALAQAAVLVLVAVATYLHLIGIQ
jgi:hypothetical protein